MSEALRIIQDPTLTYRQELLALARLGESTDDSLRYSEAYCEAKRKGALCDLNEGVMPYRPRYICPDYALLFQKGCGFLQLEPPKDLLEAVNALEIFYCHVPSITSFPVYLGDLDRLLEPFVVREDRAFAKKVLGLFLRNIDRVQTDSFVHADIGPEDSVTGRLLLELTEEMQLAVPNLTLRYDPEKTSDDLRVPASDVCSKRPSPPSPTIACLSGSGASGTPSPPATTACPSAGAGIRCPGCGCTSAPSTPGVPRISWSANCRVTSIFSWSTWTSA